MKLSGILSLFAATAIACSSPLWAAVAKPGAPSPRAAQPVKPRALAIPKNDPNNPVSNAQTIALSLPGEIRTDSLVIRLNGKDVTSRFSATSCAEGYCLTGTVSAGDGMHVGNKNVISAVAKNRDGNAISTRQRFLGGETPAPGLATAAMAKISKANARPMAAAADLGALVPGWLPPTIAFNTLQAGGYKNGSAWIRVGTSTNNKSYPSDTSFSCSSAYLTIVLDRQTLEEKTDVSPHCSPDAGDLKTFLSQRTSSDLVISGTVYGINAEPTLDTSAIGGTNYEGYADTLRPQGYIAIGVGGAPAGQAYENYWAARFGLIAPYAYGMLNEDLNGNYNFRSSNAVEYIVSPNDPSRAGQSSITIGKNVYLSGTQSTGGYYLLIMDRETLTPADSGVAGHCIAQPTSNGYTTYTNCGTFFPTNDPSGDNTKKVYNALAAAIDPYPEKWSPTPTLGPNQILFLTTVGNAAYSSTGDVWGVAASTDSSTYPVFWPELTTAMTNLGANPQDLLQLSQNTPQQTPSAYTLISGAGFQDSLIGDTVISTTYNAQQGQTGYVHGVLERDRLGFYKPGQSAQETQGHDTANLSLALVSSLTPGDWPSASGGLGICGNTCLSGPEAAFHYLSWELLNNYYIKGLNSPYKYDIHYFYTGSLNTFIDYHVFDPIDAVWPGTPGFGVGNHIACASVSSGTCTWTNSDGLTLEFTQDEFNNVKSQLSQEVVALTNVLQFMVNGSVNMKDIIAGGNANIALSLIGAASTVQASLISTRDSQIDASKIPPATVSLKAKGILDEMGKVLDIATQIAGVVGVPEELEATVDGITGNAMTFFNDASGIAGALNKPESPNIPNTDLGFETSLAELANADLQGQYSAGFDTVLDSILSDWGKLSTIGGYVTDTSNVAFYAPNQVAQNAAIQMFNKGTQRSLYLQMVPQFYYLDIWPNVFAGNDRHANPPHFAADMGSCYNGYQDAYSFYSWPETPAWAAFASPPYGLYPLNGQSTFAQNRPFKWNPKYTNEQSINMAVLGSPVNVTGETNTHISFLSPILLNALFEADQMNLPQSAFMLSTGPMSQLRSDGTSAVRDMSANGATMTWLGFDTTDICSWNDVHDTWGDNPSGVLGTPAPGTPPTTTTLTAPATNVHGDPVALSASVTSASGPVTSGTVVFHDGAGILSSVALDSTGTATVTVSSLTQGTHTITAAFVNQPGKLAASTSAPSTITVYATRPEIALTLSAGTLQISYGKTSSPVTVNAGSLSGLTGNVAFSCSGLPIGMTCNFTPATTPIGDGQTVSTKLTVTATPLQTSSISKLPGFGTLALILPLALFGFKRNRSGMRSYQVIGCFAVLGLGMAVVGCGGSGTKPTPSKPVQETGTKTILVNATCGTVTRTVPLVLNIQ